MRPNCELLGFGHDRMLRTFFDEGGASERRNVWWRCREMLKCFRVRDPRCVIRGESRRPFTPLCFTPHRKHMWKKKDRRIPETSFFCFQARRARDFRERESFSQYSTSKNRSGSDSCKTERFQRISSELTRLDVDPDRSVVEGKSFNCI